MVHIVIINLDEKGEENMRIEIEAEKMEEKQTWTLLFPIKKDEKTNDEKAEE